MAYFPHAFQKMLLALNATPFRNGNGTLKTVDLLPGQVGVINAKTNAIIDLDGTPAANYATTPVVYLAQGSYHTMDKLGGSFHGGYQETVKSKGINPKYVSRFYVTEPADAVAQTMEISVINCTNIACNTTYYLRLDVKGSPALRYLTHNAYKTFDALTPCCDSETPASNVDPAIVFLAWKDQINADVLMSKFVQAEVFNMTTASVAINPTAASTTIVVANADKTSFTAGELVEHASLAPNSRVVSVGADDSASAGFANVVLTEAAVASTDGNAKVYTAIATDTYTVETGASADTNDLKMLLTAAYVDTVFGDCSFDVNDFYEKEPLYVYPSFVEESGDRCATNCFTVEELVEARQGEGFGETIIRELILDKRYRQEPFQENPRMREVLDDTTLSDISRSSKYYAYHILHSVPRNSNPSGTMDADQYLIKVVVSARNSNFEAYMNALLTSAGNAGVQLEVI